MANLKATLIWRCKTSEGWKRFPVVEALHASKYPNGCVIKATNGRIPLGRVTIAGVVHEHKQGTYQLRTYEGRRVVYKPVKAKDGTSGSGGDAFEALEREQEQLKAKHSAKKAGLEVVEKDDDEKPKLTAQRDAFMKSKKIIGANTTTVSYRIALERFFLRCSKQHAADLKADDVIDYVAYLRKNFSPGTVFLYYGRLMTFLNYCGIAKHFLNKRERPKKPKDKPKPYSAAEIAKLFAVVDRPQYALAYELLLKTGMRKQELMYLQWGDIDFDKSRVHVRNKPKLGFLTKTRQERSIPLMDPLLRNRLAQWQQRHKDWKFIFGVNKGEDVNTEFLAWLKRFIRKAGMNCGHCETCQSKNKRCSYWTIHKFRHTFATQCVRKNINPRTVQAWLGHQSLEITMKYLASLTDDDAAVEQMTNVFDDFVTTAPPKIVEMPTRKVS